MKARDTWGAGSIISDSLLVTITDNQPPENPTITGPASVKPLKEYLFVINTTDPQGQDIKYDFDWGDGNGVSNQGPYKSGQEVYLKHTWKVKGTYTIKVRALDILDMESDWTYLEVNVPRNRVLSINTILQQILEHFPNTFFILRHLLGA